MPKGMNISGSASFFAKADLGITVHRNTNMDEEVHCLTVRFKWLGQVGKTTLNYDIPTGRYSDPVLSMDIPDELSRAHHETENDW